MKWIRLAALFAALALVLGACSDDDGGGNSTEAFCDRLQELIDGEELDLEDEESLDVIDELVDLAPEEIDSDMERINDAFQEIVELSESDDADAFERVFEIVLDPRLASAVEDFEEFAEDECDVDVEGTSGFGEDLTDDFTADFSDDFTADFSDDFSSDVDDDDDGPSNTDLLEEFLETNYGDEPWVELIGSRGVGSVMDVRADVTLGMDEVIPPEQAVEACEAALAWLEQTQYDEGGAEVLGPDQETLAEGDLGGSCEAA